MTMINTRKQPTAIRSHGVFLDTTPKCFGYLRDSTDLLGDSDRLREQMARDGYLFLPGLLHREEVLAARAEMVRRLAESGILKVGTDPMDAIIAPGRASTFMPELALNNTALGKVLYAGPMMAFFEKYFAAPVRHFDFTWVRAISPGNGTRSHCDSVYMNRGTHHLYTAWTPIGDVSFELGGLMVLEGSNNNQRLKETYGLQDVDSFCENKPDAKKWGKAWGTDGSLQGNPNQIRKSVVGGNPQGGRWLSAEYRAGDVLLFSIFTVHASLDNTTADRIRFSCDSRYQPASEPADERWIGPSPIGHGPAGKKGKIC